MRAPKIFENTVEVWRRLLRDEVRSRVSVLRLAACETE